VKQIVPSDSQPVVIEAPVPSPQATGERRRPRLPSRRRVLLALYGLVIALAAFPVIHAANPGLKLNQTRKYDMQQGLNVLNAGGPPLLGRGPPPYASIEPRFGQRSGYYPLGIADAQGLYLVVPYVGHLVGAHNALGVYRWLFVFVFAIPLLVYPLIFDALFGSVLLALAAPLALLALVGAQAPEDAVVLATWPVYALVPLLFLLARRWTRLTPWALLGVTLLAGLATNVREGAGLPIVLSALLLVFLNRRHLGATRGLALAVAMIVVYMLPGWGTAALWHHERGHIANPYLRDQAIVHQSRWHQLVLGLSFPGNNYGVPRHEDRSGYAEDQFAYALARARDPSVVILSPHYETLEKEIYFGIVEGHPGFVALGYLKRTVIVLSYLGVFWLGFLFLPLMLLVGKRRWLMRRYLALLAPVGIITLFGPAVLVSQGYDGQFKATATILAFLAGGWLMVNWARGYELVRIAWPGRPASPGGWLHSYRALDPRCRTALALTTAVVIAALLITLAGTSFQSQYH